MYKALKTVIVKRPREAFSNDAYLKDHWQQYGFTEQPDFEKAVMEFEQFEKILEQYVSVIIRLNHAEGVGIDSIYSHDAVKFTPKGAILLNSGKALRRTETAAFKELLKAYNMPVLGELTGEATCDGGDIVWLNEDTIAIGRSYRTNDEGIRQLQLLLEPIVANIKIIQLPHHLGEEACLHLMSILSIVDEKLAVVYSPLMPVELRQWLLKDGYALIEVPTEEYENLACNVLALAPKICVIVEGNPITKKQLEDAGATVYTYEGNEISLKGTGGPTCLTCPVERV